MVAKRKRTHWSTSPVYLTGLLLILSAACLSLVSCGNDTATVIELKNKPANDFERILSLHYDDTSAYDISGKHIVLLEPPSSELISIIEKIDAGPSRFVLSFNDKNVKHYSTQTLPSEVILNPLQPTKFSHNETRLTLNIEPVDDDSSQLNIVIEDQRRESLEQYSILVRHGEWQSLKLIKGIKRIHLTPFTLNDAQ